MDSMKKIDERGRAYVEAPNEGHLTVRGLGSFLTAVMTDFGDINIPKCKVSVRWYVTDDEEEDASDQQSVTSVTLTRDKQLLFMTEYCATNVMTLGDMLAAMDELIPALQQHRLAGFQNDYGHIGHVTRAYHDKEVVMLWVKVERER